jgi:predicted dienelactone hydrolase
MTMPPLTELLLFTLPIAWVLGVLAGGRHHERFLVAFLAGTLVAGTVHVSAGEPRWPLVPLYLFIGIVAFRAALDLGHLDDRPVPTWRRVLARLGLGLVAAVVVLVPGWLLPQVRYQPPTGPYQVGTRAEYWVDSTRPEVFTPDPGDLRRLAVQIWYPAEPGPEAERVRLHPFPDRLARVLAAGMPGMPAFIFSGLGRGVTWAFEEAPVSGAERSFPLLVFSHGFGGTRFQNGFQMAEIASHGYVIVAADHSHTAAGTVFPDGAEAVMDSATAKVLESDSVSTRVVNIWAADGRFLIDRMLELVRADPKRMLTGRIDTTRIGYFGHSFGGATAAQVMSQDTRVLAGINMDGYLAGTAWVAGLDRPFLQMRSDSIDVGAFSEEELARVGTSREKLRALVREWDRRTGPVIAAGGLEVHVVGTAHMNYSDYPLWSPPLTRILGLAGSANHQRAHQLVNALTLAFFDRHLKQRPGGLLDRLGAGPYAALERTRP